MRRGVAGSGRGERRGRSQSDLPGSHLGHLNENLNGIPSQSRKIRLSAMSMCQLASKSLVSVKTS
jgi:hypothetical protein